MTFDDSVREISRKHNISQASALQLCQGLLTTCGGQVQFNIPEFGGMGQWMPGMVMAGDMFNHALKARIDAVCTDISNRIRSGAIKMSQHTEDDAVSLRWTGANWWPQELGSPDTAGAQNNMRYAWFPQSRRLAVDLGGRIWIYDTGDHQISGVSQQQSATGVTLTFTSQHGVMDLSKLPVVSTS